MNRLQLSILVCFGIYLILILYNVIQVGGFTRDLNMIVGLIGILLGAFLLFLGVVLSIVLTSKEIGQGVLIASGLMILIGIGVCSLAPFGI